MPVRKVKAVTSGAEKEKTTRQRSKHYGRQEPYMQADGEKRRKSKT